MKASRYLLLFFVITVRTIKSDVAQFSAAVDQALMESNIILNPEEQIQKAISNNDLVLFVEIIKKIKSEKIPLKLILRNKDNYLQDVTDKIANTIEQYGGPYTAEEWLKLTGGSIATLTCLLLFTGALVGSTGAGAHNSEAVARIGTACIFLGFLSAAATVKVALRDFCKTDLIKLRKIKKLLKTSFNWKTAQI